MSGQNHFDARVATHYDDDLGAMGGSVAIDPAVDLLAALAGCGRALEFAIGTGRLALPLAKRGIPVAGIDLSRPMLDRLRAKPGGAAIPVALGDMTTTRLEGSFSLVYLVFNTITNLTSQDAQIACFQNAAAHLAPGGRFLIEVGLPPLQRLPVGQTLLAFDLGEQHWGIDEIDTVSQRCTSHHVFARAGGLERHAIPLRYVWPSELDLMARLAGLELVERWQNWHRTPFTALSEGHLSIWQKPSP